MPLEKRLSRLMVRLNQMTNQGHRIKMKLTESFAHVGIFLRLYMKEYVTAKMGSHHGAISKSFPLTEKGKHINILAPRGSAKSTIMAVVYPLHSVFFKEVFERLDIDPYHFIVIVSKSFPMAKSRVQDIKRKIETDPVFEHLKGEKTWGEQRIITSNDTMLVPNSRGGQIRGSLFGPARPDLVIIDDLDDPETVNNPDVRSKDLLWFDTDLIRCGRLDRGTNFLNADTVKHAESTANLLRDRSGWETLLFRAIEQPADLWHPTAEERWREWERKYTDMALDTKERHAGAQGFFEKHRAEMTTGVKELWPEIITYLDVRKEICDVGYYPVMRELQNSTHDPSQALFDMDRALYFDIKAEGFLTSENVLIKWQELSGATIFLDWAGGKDIADNAYAAVVAVVWRPMPGNRNTKDVNSIMDGVHGYVLDADLRRMGSTEQIQACLDMHDRIKAVVKTTNFSIRLGVEGFVQDTWQAQRKVIERDFRAQNEDRQIKIHIEWLTRLHNKFDRIDALQPLIRNRWLAFKNGLQNEFVKEMTLYPTGDFVDGPDALEGACQLRIARFESERKERRERNKERNKNFKVEI